MHIYALLGMVSNLFDGQVRDFGVQHHRVQRPAVALVGSRDLLLHRRQETLRVEKPGHPVTVGFAAGEPAPELGVPKQQPAVPQTQTWRQPRQLIACRTVQPRFRHSCVVDGINGIHDLGSDHHFTANGLHHHLQCTLHLEDYCLHSLDLLVKKNVEWDGEATQSGNAFLVLVLDVVCRHGSDQFIALGKHNLLSSFAACRTTGLLGLRLHNGVQQLVNFLESEGEVRVGVQADDLWRVDVGELLDVPHEVLHLDVVGDAVHKVLRHLVDGILRVEGES
mmetsp:Transcript_30195/g.41428  ORF Transcript_30195/g.41428 Transcript_30195/m.41428 type:complete len:279 (-) Transcript_30195:706-1542(-)